MHDFNLLEMRARELKAQQRFRDALSIYLHMVDGDSSLDAGYLGEKIAECYEALDDLYSAKYWFGRALEENPQVRLKARNARQRLSATGIDHLLEDK
jgi:tetratricopeptide (TPR) repeat protein